MPERPVPDEDAIDVPDAWCQAVRPRRGGRLPVWHYAVPAAESAAWADGAAARRGAQEEVLGHPASDPQLVALARSRGESVEAEGVRLVLDLHSDWSAGLAVVDACVRRHGPARAAAICVASTGYQVDHGLLHGGPRGRALVRLTDEWDADPRNVGVREVPEIGLDHLRRLLVVADDDAHREAVVALGTFRTGPFAQRCATSYLLPEQRDWVAADLAELPPGLGHRARLLGYSGHTAAHFRDTGPWSMAQAVTAWDVLGHDAVPVLLGWFDRAYVDVELRQQLLDVIARIPTDAAVDGLLDRLELADVAGALAAAGNRFPLRTARLLAARGDEPFAGHALARHRAAHPDLPDDGAAARLPVALDDLVPALLATPPWTRPAPRRVQVDGPLPQATIHWLPEEQERWAWDWWPPVDPDAWTEEDRSGPSAAFVLRGPEDEVRPRLAGWAAERAQLYMQNPRRLVARFELDALPAALRLARRKPSVGAELLLPYRDVDVAHLMAGWLAGSRQFRPLAHGWFERHGADGVALLLPTALGAPPARSRAVLLALTRLDPDTVLAAGRRLGRAEETEALLAVDPLHLVPARVPRLPAWLAAELLPPVLLADGRHVLPGQAVEVLLRMAAMSPLDQPYEGLRIVREACDRDSLVALGWSVFAAWHAAGRPSKDAWALDALAWFGDDEVADRLTGMILRWPSQGAAPRAKRGVEVLAAMESEAALRHLGVIARTARSTPLRAHAGSVLDRAALDRGLLPEQLDDLLAPDLDLGTVVHHGGAEFTVELGDGPELVLRGAGGDLTALPRPRDDDEREQRSWWSAHRKRALPALRDQVRRLEEAMVVQRSWTRAEFASSIAAHPLLGRLARHLVWCADGRTAAVDALGDLVDREGALLLDVQDIRLAHPATEDLSAWTHWWAARSVVQPFPQVDRDVHDGDPSAHWDRVVSAAALHALVRRGWQWGPSGHGARRDRVLRPLGPAGTVVLVVGPGVSAVADAAAEPDQVIERLELDSPRHGELAVFGDLPRVTRSELLRDLALLR